MLLVLGHVWCVAWVQAALPLCLLGCCVVLTSPHPALHEPLLTPHDT